MVETAVIEEKVLIQQYISLFFLKIQIFNNKKGIREDSISKSLKSLNWIRPNRFDLEVLKSAIEAQIRSANLKYLESYDIPQGYAKDLDKSDWPDFFFKKIFAPISLNDYKEYMGKIVRVLEYQLDILKDPEKYKHAYDSIMNSFNEEIMHINGLFSIEMVSPDLERIRDAKTEMGRTIAAFNRFRKEHKEAEDKYVTGDYWVYKGEKRHLIHRGTPIDRGVYIGKYAREAVTVDFDKNEILKKLYKEATAKLGVRAKLFGFENEEAAARYVFEVVKNYLKAMGDLYTNVTINNYIRKHNIKEKEFQIPLFEFLKNRTGVCRHCVLTCAAIIERMIKKRYIRGEVSVDRIGPHAWCRYTTKEGNILILDVAQGYFGTLEKDLITGKAPKHSYFRNEDSKGRAKRKTPSARTLEKIRKKLGEPSFGRA